MKIISFLCFSLILFSCATKSQKIKINKDHNRPGTFVTFKGEKLNLYKGNIKVGDNFLKKFNKTGLNFKFKNKVTIINIVPSIDTPVCDQQTHLLGETKLPKAIDLVTISRDLPMAQTRFAKKAKLENIRYFSDYKYGKFGKKSGLLIKDEELLARAVVLLDQKGIIKYIQVVPEITNLPNMEQVFKKATSLLTERDKLSPSY